MRNQSNVKSFKFTIVMMFVLGIMILPIGLFADSGTIVPPPPDSSGHNDMIIIDSTNVDPDTSQSELSFMESITLELMLLLIF